MEERKYVDIILDEIEKVFLNKFVYGIPAKQTRTIVNAMAKRGWWREGDLPVPSEAIGIDKALVYSAQTGKLGIVVINSPGVILSMRSIISALHLDVTGRKGRILILTGSDSHSSIGLSSYEMQPQHASGADLAASMVRDCISGYAQIVSCPQDAQNAIVNAMNFLQNDQQGSIALVALPPEIKCGVGAVTYSKSDPVLHENLSLENFMQEIQSAKNPLFYVCGGSVEALHAVKNHELPHVLGISARAHTGCNHLGCYGGVAFAGHEPGQLALTKSDLVVVVGWIGRDFDDALKGCASNVKVVYLSENKFSDSLTRTYRSGHVCLVDNWRNLCTEVKKVIGDVNNSPITFFSKRDNDSKKRVSPALLAQRLNNYLPRKTMIFADSGNSMSLFPHNVLDHPVSTDISNGCMGHSLGQALGWGAAHPEKVYVNVVGDGSFLMNTNILPYVANLKLFGIMIVLNDGQLGMVNHGQMMHGDPLVATRLSVDNEPVDFAAIATACHIPFVRRIKNNEQVEEALQELMAYMEAREGPAFLDVRIDKEEVPPMAARIDNG